MLPLLGSWWDVYVRVSRVIAAEEDGSESTAALEVNSSGSAIDCLIEVIAVEGEEKQKASCRCGKEVKRGLEFSGNV